MNRIGKFIRALGLFIRNYQGDWEGGDSTSTRRGKVGSPWRWYGRPPGPNEANDERSRMEVIRKVQHFERNNSLVNKTLDLIELYCAGATGMPVFPASSDLEWNARRKIKWDRWCVNPDLTSLDSFGTMQRLMARCRARDGRVLVFLTRSDTPIRHLGERYPQYRPRIQLIEAARLFTPTEFQGRRDIIDGIQVDAKGRPVSYYITESDAGGLIQSIGTASAKYKRLPAENVIDFNLKMRPGEMHPMSLFAPVLNDIQDLNELFAFAMDKAKDASMTKKVYMTKDGEVPTSQDLRRQGYEVQQETIGGATVTEDRIAQFRQVFGSESMAIREGEKVEQFEAKSPNQIEQAHFDIVFNRICAGTGVSRLLVSPIGMSIQGTVARGEYDIADGFFRAGASDLQEVISRIFEYVTFEESQYDPEIGENMPDDWRKCHIRSPRRCNVDVGHNSAAAMAELSMGARTYQSIYGPLGEDAREQIIIGLDELAFIRVEAQKRGVEPAEFSQKIGEALKLQMEKEAASRAEEDKDLVAA